MYICKKYMSARMPALSVFPGVNVCFASVSLPPCYAICFVLLLRCVYLPTYVSIVLWHQRTQQTKHKKHTNNPPGQYFGEMALIKGCIVHTTTVTTIQRAVLLSISRDNLDKFFALAPEAAATFEVKLSRYDVPLDN